MASEQPSQLTEWNALARRVVGAGDEDHVGAALDDGRHGHVDVER